MSKVQCRDICMRKGQGANKVALVGGIGDGEESFDILGWLKSIVFASHLGCDHILQLSRRSISAHSFIHLTIHLTISYNILILCPLHVHSRSPRSRPRRPTASTQQLARLRVTPSHERRASVVAWDERQFPREHARDKGCH